MMARTDWIFSGEDHSLHQEFPAEGSDINPSDNTNPAQLIIDFPNSFNVTQGHTGDDAFSLIHFRLIASVIKI